MTPCMSHMTKKKSCDHQMCLFSKQLIAKIDMFAIAACSIIKLFLLTCRALSLIAPYCRHLIGDRNVHDMSTFFILFSHLSLRHLMVFSVVVQHVDHYIQLVSIQK